MDGKTETHLIKALSGNIENVNIFTRYAESAHKAVFDLKQKNTSKIQAILFLIITNAITGYALFQNVNFGG